MLFRVPLWVRDLTATLIVGGASLGPSIHRGDRWWITVPLSLVATVAIYFRRRWPLPVLAVEAGVAFLFLVAGHANVGIGALFAVFTVAALTNRRLSLQLTVMVTALLAIPVLWNAKWDPSNLAGVLALMGLAWFAGESFRVREHDRQEKLRQAAADERTRIARELHDVITHNVSVMVVQAAAAGEVFDSRPDQSRAAISEVEETGRRALNELRRLLGSVAEGDTGVLPQPSLDRVDELVERVRAAGLDVELRREGEPARLPDGVELSGYRIVQESLTNTIKHAHASRVTVVLRYLPGELEVEVTDNGVGGGERGAGRGLIGMQERVALYGGDLDAGTRSGGGYGVRARIPLVAS